MKSNSVFPSVFSIVDMKIARKELFFRPAIRPSRPTESIDL